jgi:hypothetical protein
VFNRTENLLRPSKLWPETCSIDLHLGAYRPAGPLSRSHNTEPAARRVFWPLRSEELCSGALCHLSQESLGAVSLSGQTKSKLLEKDNQGPDVSDQLLLMGFLVTSAHPHLPRLSLVLEIC